MRVLIYGAGVIGSLYAALFSSAGVDTTVYARGQRLEGLKQHGLRYEKSVTVRTPNVRILDTLYPNDLYDFIFLTVRENQLHAALTQLRENRSPCIVTMVNSIEDYSVWEQLCGAGRILPAFPGAGGGFEQGVLHAVLTPRLIQPTTFGVLTSKQLPQAKQLKMLSSVQKFHISRSRICMRGNSAISAWSCLSRTLIMRQPIPLMLEQIRQLWRTPHKGCGKISGRWRSMAFPCLPRKCRCSVSFRCR